MKSRLFPYLYIMPAVLVVGLIVFFPDIYSIYLAFTNYGLYHFDSFNFVGLQNFREILFSQEISTFLRVFWWTVIWALGSVFLQLGAGLLLALVLNMRNLKGTNIYRTLLIIPWAVPSFITVLMWTGILNTDYGSLNQILAGTKWLIPIIKWNLAVINFFIVKINYVLNMIMAHHVTFQPGDIKHYLETFSLNAKNQCPWLDEGPWAKVSVLIVNLWLGFPFMMSISLGALQSIPQDLYEAASIDGASKYYQFRRITLPLMRSALLPVIITSFAFNFNNFVGIYLLTVGGPAVPGSIAGATDILVSYTYKLAFNLSQYGLACAYAVLIFILIGSLSAANFKLTGAFKD